LNILLTVSKGINDFVLQCSSLPVKTGIDKSHNQCAASVEAAAPNFGRDSQTKAISRKNSSDDA
jgi:hypothetical protein